MKCSSCSAPIKPVVAIDIDGTLGDYHLHFLAFAQAYVGYSIASKTDYEDLAVDGYHGQIGFKEWTCAALSIDERIWHDIKLAYRQGGQKRSMPIFTSAQRLCRGVRALGAELWLTTTRPYMRLDNIDPDTRAWLERHGIEYDGLLYDELKYESLAARVDSDRVVAVVDDLKEMCDAAAMSFGSAVPILRSTTYNSAVRTQYSHYCSLVDMLHDIEGRLEGWYIRHGDSRLHSDPSTY